MTDSADSAISRAEGVTPAERYLQRLCDRSFLSLWSHTGIFRDQRTGTKGDGKEVCDLLIVFGGDLIIFSDKACAFKVTGNLQLDWSRWFRKAVTKSADQVWGAERWIKEHPDRLFLDRSCNRRFPIDLPNVAQARFHRIVVAHNISKPCRNALGGSGSLIVDTTITGPSHLNSPFTIGQLDPARGFVHVLDDITLDTLLVNLNTISDFVQYLNTKERLIDEGHILYAAGEEDLLAVYLRDVNDEGEHDLVVAPGCQGIAVEEGAWSNFVHHPQRQAQIDADRISYRWDALIEKFAYYTMAGTQYRTTHHGIGDTERGLRFMAREKRTHRRMLAEALYEILEKTPRIGQRATRIVPPFEPGAPLYVFLLLPREPSISDETYRLTRERMLQACCLITKLVNPDAQHIVGIATETRGSDSSSEDFIYLDATKWSEQDNEEARVLQHQTGLLTNIIKSEKTAYEYPSVSESIAENVGPNPRNKPCPCGSGKKYKKCCLK